MMSRYHAFSIIFHAVVFLFAVMVLQPLIPASSLGEPQVEMIRAYIQTEASTPSVKTPEPKLQIQKSKPVTSVTRQQLAVKKVKQNISTESAVKQTARGEQVDELLRLLHRVIQGVQRYPASAQAMGREGRATIAFKLLLDGAVTDVVLQKSSGVSSLDSAALAAINDAAPFHGVDRYLSEPRSFTIDVVFALS